MFFLDSCIGELLVPVNCGQRIELYFLHKNISYSFDLGVVIVLRNLVKKRKVKFVKQLFIIFFLLLFYGCWDKSITPSTSTENTANSSNDSSNSYNKIEWQKMDANQDGSVSPKEMKDHYREKGVYD